MSPIDNTAGSDAASNAAGMNRMKMEIYTVESGDSLSKIAKQYYGDASQWKRIYEANRDQIDNPDLIQVGQVIQIPMD